MQIGLEFIDLLLEHIRCVSKTTDDTKTTSVGDSCGQLRPSSHVHTRQQNWVVDLEKISERSANLFCVMMREC